MTGYTKGPWTVERYGDGDSLVIHSNHVNRVCFMATPGSHGDPATIAADARLIAAAPELYEALKGLLNIVAESRGIDGFHLNGNVAEWGEFEEVESANAAIAKATGDTDGT